MLSIFDNVYNIVDENFDNVSLQSKQFTKSNDLVLIFYLWNNTNKKEYTFQMFILETINKPK
jgi:hypothetical protein